MKVRGLVVEEGPNGRFIHSGGHATFDKMDICENAVYELTGGSLRIARELRKGTFDFAGSDASLIAGDLGFLELDRMELLATQTEIKSASRCSVREYDIV